MGDADAPKLQQNVIKSAKQKQADVMDEDGNGSDAEC